MNSNMNLGNMLLLWTLLVIGTSAQIIGLGCDTYGAVECFQHVETALSSNTSDQCGQIDTSSNIGTCLNTTAGTCGGFLGHASNLAQAFFSLRSNLSEGCSVPVGNTNTTNGSCHEHAIGTCLRGFVESLSRLAGSVDLMDANVDLQLDYNSTCSPLSDALMCIENSVTSHSSCLDTGFQQDLLTSLHLAYDDQCTSSSCQLEEATRCLDSLNSEVASDVCSAIEETESCVYTHIEACSSFTREVLGGKTRSARARIGASCPVTCGARPCLNGGTCGMTSHMRQGYMCRCPTGYQGSNCQLETSKMPQIRDVTPLFGPVAGGTLLTIEGQNFPLDVEAVRFGTHRRLDITYCNSTVIVAQSPEVSEQYVDRVMDVIVVFPGLYSMVSGYKFVYRRNPVVISVQPLRIIPAGGITLTVRGSFLDSVSAPLMEMFPRDTSAPISSDPGNETERCLLNCDVVSANVLHCESPILNLTESTRVDDLVIHLGFVFDGLRDYRNLSEIDDLQEYGTVLVMPNPTFLGEQRLEYNGLPISIKGQNVRTCCELHEFDVYFGSKKGKITKIDDSHLWCMPPPRPPPHHHNASRASRVREHPLKVRVGTKLEYFVGTVHYVDPPLPLWVVPAAVFGSAFLLAAVSFTFVMTCAPSSSSSSRGRSGPMDPLEIASSVGDKSDKMSEPKLSDFAYNGRD